VVCLVNASVLVEAKKAENEHLAASEWFLWKIN
jgi:hypothetical protein